MKACESSFPFRGSVFSKFSTRKLCIISTKYGKTELRFAVLNWPEFSKRKSVSYFFYDLLTAIILMIVFSERNIKEHRGRK